MRYVPLRCIHGCPADFPHPLSGARSVLENPVTNLIDQRMSTPNFLSFKNRNIEIKIKIFYVQKEIKCAGKLHRVIMEPSSMEHAGNFSSSKHHPHLLPAATVAHELYLNKKLSHACSAVCSPFSFVSASVI